MKHHSLFSFLEVRGGLIIQYKIYVQNELIEVAVVLTQISDQFGVSDQFGGVNIFQIAGALSLKEFKESS